MQCTTDPLGFPRKMRSGFKNWEDARFVTVVKQDLRRENCLANTMFPLWLEYACTIVHIYQSQGQKQSQRIYEDNIVLKLPPDSRYEVTQGPDAIWKLARNVSLAILVADSPWQISNSGVFWLWPRKILSVREKVAFRITNSSFSNLLICISQLEHHLKMPHWYQKRDWLNYNVQPPAISYS